MPKCKNDLTRSYKGTEPSPKGLGYCAHSMKVGAVKKGKDGNKWIVKEIKNGSKRWMKVNEYDINKVKKYLENKIYKWWYKLGTGGIIIVYKNNNYKLLCPKKGIKKQEEHEKKWEKLENNKNVKYIVWSSMSSENLQQFVNYLLFKTPNNIIEKFITSNNTLDIFIKNIKKLIAKYSEVTNKDYSLQREYHFERHGDKFKNKILKKLLKSKIIKQKM
jgi:hypothetical protein